MTNEMELGLIMMDVMTDLTNEYHFSEKEEKWINPPYDNHDSMIRKY
jgi:hypothetical protein